jgi:hypothetical protein
LRQEVPKDFFSEKTPFSKIPKKSDFLSNFFPFGKLKTSAHFLYQCEIPLLLISG